MLKTKRAYMWAVSDLDDSILPLFTLVFLTMPFPSLPLSTSTATWPPYVHAASANLQQIYENASRALQNEAEGRRIIFHLETIESDVIPVLYALEQTHEFRIAGFADWVRDLGRAFATLQVHAENARNTAIGRCMSYIFINMDNI